MIIIISKPGVIKFAIDNVGEKITHHASHGMICKRNSS
jgi:hypothetical protein